MKTNFEVWDWRSYIIEFAPDNSTYKLVLLTLSCYMNSAGGSCFPSVQTISEDASLSKKSVIKYLNKANEDGWIEKGIHGYSGQGWKRNEYTASVPEKVVNEIHNVKKGGEPEGKGGEPRSEGGEGGSHYHSNNSPSTTPKENSIKENKPEFAKHPFTEELTEVPSFEEFYELYDNKKGKTKAEKSWGKLSNSEKVKAIVAVPYYKKSLPEWQDMKYPSTFINQKTWRDEAIYNKQNHRHGKRRPSQDGFDMEKARRDLSGVI